MRLSESERLSITSVIKLHFEPEARLFLFGSRVDDTKHGGDIDLYLETCLKGEKLIRAKLCAISDIQRRIGDQKIDLVTSSPESSHDLPLVIQRARQMGVAL